MILLIIHRNASFELKSNKKRKNTHQRNTSEWPMQRARVYGAFRC